MFQNKGLTPKKSLDASEFPRSGYTATTARSLGPTLKSISKAWLPAIKILHLPSNTKMSLGVSIVVTDFQGFTHGIIAMAG